MGHKISIAHMADEVERTLGERRRTYPALVNAGKLRLDDADRAMLHMEATRNLLNILAEHEDTLRAAIRAELERKNLLRHPASVALLQAFPEAKLVEIRPTK